MIHRHTTRQRYTALALAAVLILATLMLALWPRGDAGAAAPSRFTKSGPALAEQGRVGSWSCGDGPAWQVGDRFGDGGADSTALGTSLTDGYLVYLVQNTPGRYYHMVLYAPPDPEGTPNGRQGGDLILDVPFSYLQPEPGTTYPTGRFDPIGKPTLTYHGNMVKIVVGLYAGEGRSDHRGGRIYTWCSITPRNPG